MVVVLVLAVPWYPTTITQQIPQTSTYLAYFTMPIATTTTEVVYSLPEPVTIQPASNPMSCLTNFLTNPQCVSFTSAVNGFLTSGSTIQVTVVECQTCYLLLWQTSPPNFIHII